MKRFLNTMMVCLAVSLSLGAQTQQGIVKTPGRLDSNGHVIAGKRLSGATVQVKGRNSVVSGANGTFSFPIPANKFSIQSVKKQGYILTDPEATARQYTYSSDPLILVMETPGQQVDSKLANERKIRRSLQSQLQAKEDELEALKEQNRINEEEYRRQLQQIYQEQEDNEKLISDIAERYSQIDFDQLDEFNLRISDCILNGRLTEADSLLRSKGDINTRIAAVHLQEAAEAQEEAELARRQENLEKSKAGTKATIDEIAQDCYNYHQKFLMEHMNDSAAHYLELRAALDTTNVEWQYEAGSFIEEYQAKHEMALSYYQRGLQRSILQYGIQSEMVAKFYTQMGCIATIYGDYSTALACFLEALDINELVLGSEHPNVATTDDFIGFIYVSLGDSAQALEYFRKALSIKRMTFNADHPAIATSYNNIGVVYNSKDDYDIALDYYQKALDIRLRVYGSQHHSVASSYFNMGTLYASEGNYNNALDYYLKGLEICENLYGLEHPVIARYLNSIGDVYAHQGNYTQALECYFKALDIRKRIQGMDNPEIAEYYSDIGSTYFDQGDYVNAIEYFMKALSIRERVLDVDNPDLAKSYGEVGYVFFKEGDYIRALEYYHKSLDIYERVSGLLHPDVATTNGYIGMSNLYLRNYTESLEYFSKAYNGYLNAYGEEHSLTQQIKKNIDYLKEKLGQ